jgi:hypothetical protein
MLGLPAVLPAGGLAVDGGAALAICRHCPAA